MLKIVAYVGADPIYIDDNGNVHFMGEMKIDGDGSPRNYAPVGSGLKPLDYLANAGSPGNWWGIATDSSGKPFIQGKDNPYPGYYVSTTALKNPGFKHGDPRREVDSETVPFIVVPPQIIKGVKPIVLGCKARITDTKTGKQVYAVVADVGPKAHLGEASIAAANALEIPSDPKRGGSSQKRFLYELWPGEAAEGFKLQPSK